MGLAGLYVIHDPIDAALGLPSGAYDVPLVIQDRAFNRDGTLYYPPTWQEHFFGDVVLVNGKVWPYLDVRRGKYLFRVLNGSNGRTYALRLSTGATFQVIGNDGGLLPAPATVSNLVLAPGERAEIVIDFAGLPAGTEVELLNDAPAPYPGLATENVIPRVMKFVVQSTAGHTAAIPATLRPMTRLVEASAIATRDFELAKSPDACGGSTWMINGEGWSTITERPVLGTTEVWRFMNRSGVMHPMHMHLVFFQVLDRQPFEVVGGVVTPIGARSLPAPGEAGWKDTVQVGPNEIVRVIARFDDYVGRYPYHCHVLEHEDHQMMRQFETTTVCGDGIVSAPIEDCDDGNTTMGDGCEPDCTYSCGADADCSDGNACNGAESCVLATHVCAFGVPLGCDDADACTVDACDPASGCTHATVTCDDGNPCTVDGCAPASGCTVTPVADGTPCAEGACIAGACTPLPDAGPGDAGTFDGGASDAGPALDGGGDDAGPRADAGPGADAGPMPADAAADAAPDAASDAGPLPGDTSGCGCRVPSSTPRAPLALLCTAIVIVLLRVARRRRS